MTASFVGVALAVAHVAQGVADGAGFRGPLSASLRVARRAKAPVPTQAGTTLTLLLQDGADSPWVPASHGSDSER